ncbi:bestrophin homolog 1-like isoform X1 [Ostrinia nubilalis]|uniref:bestrophin homolog 1 isoform X1 n=2 Tax=Ostrinia furnacalis TaxID=93504 RepID=UPI00103F9DAD|nr:bestrophin homolog 1 isoform X1 [Ostrinia furnacalis]
MTITYTGDVATCRGFGTFLKVLYRWRGSIYKLVWLDLLIFLLLYYTLSLTYRLLLDPESKRIFEGVVNYCSFHGNVIPLSFVLGFYVTVVMNRWWGQYTTIPWPDSIAVFVSASIHGQDERGRLMRRTIVRYVCLCLTMVLTMISPRVKKRFPTLNNLVDAGLLLDNEKTILENLNDKFPKPSKHWLPIVWATSIVTRARKEGRIRDDFAVKTIIDELNKFRGQAGLLLSYDTISVPLVYTQVVTIAVYSYFITSALGSQWVDNKLESHSSTNISNIDLYFPIFNTLEFFFYMGWLKVAESLINPFGEDDDDFEVNWLIDRDLQVSYMIVDEMHHEHPELIRDQYWDEVFPSELPYTIATENQREEHPEPSTSRVSVPVRQRSMVTVAPSALKIDEMVPSNTVSYKFAPPEQLQMNDDAQSGIHFIVSRGSKRGKKEDRNSMGMGSSNSMVSLQQTPMTRNNSVTSMLKRLFSKEDQRTGTTPPVASQTDGGTRFTISASNASLNKPTTAGGGSMKIANEVIEEVDEQATITSMGKRPENRPTAMSLFSPPAPSEPVDVPSKIANHTTTDHRLSSSAPSAWSRAPVGDTSPAVQSLNTHNSFASITDARPRLDSDVGASLSAAGSQTLLDEVDGAGETDADDFERLRSIRDARRRDKYLQKLMARSISAQQTTGSNELIDNDLLLEELLTQSAINQKNEKNARNDSKDQDAT